MYAKLWKRIDEYPDYWVSSIGEIYSTKSNKFLKAKVVRGYLYVDLYNNNDKKHLTVHRLVAQAFIPNPDNKPCIDHINTIRDDNGVENLRWVSYAENANNELTRKHNSESKLGKHHSEETRAKMSGENHPMWGKHCSSDTKQKISEANKGKRASDETRIKLSEARSGENNPRARVVRCVELDKIFTTIKEAKEATGAGDISACCRGKTKTSGGYHWEYVDNL